MKAVSAAALPGMEEAHAASINELLRLMVEEHGFDVREAMLLLSAVMEARCTLIHGMEGFPITYLAKIDKRYLRPDPTFVPYRGEMPESGREGRGRITTFLMMPDATWSLMTTTNAVITTSNVNFFQFTLTGRQYNTKSHNNHRYNGIQVNLPDTIHHS